jgi:hypothetical protein
MWSIKHHAMKTMGAESKAPRMDAGGGRVQASTTPAFFKKSELQKKDKEVYGANCIENTVLPSNDSLEYSRVMRKNIVKRAKWNLQVLLLADTPLPILNLGTRWR